MPITLKEFENREFVFNKKDSIAKFLEQNKEKAFKAVEIAKEFEMTIQAMAPYLNTLEKEGRINHKRPFWTYLGHGKKIEMKTTKPPENISISTDEEKLWGVISDSKGSTLTTLAQRKKRQNFKIVETNDNYLRIKFSGSGAQLKIEKLRFALAYRQIKKNRGNWVEINASRINTKPNSLEGAIKLGMDGKLNGLSTATWVASLLVECDPRIVFNGKLRNQCLMYK